MTLPRILLLVELLVTCHCFLDVCALAPTFPIARTKLSSLAHFYAGSRHRPHTLALSMTSSDSDEKRKSFLAVSLAVTVAATTLFGLQQLANAYVTSDYASETVQAAIQELKSASGSIDQTFKAYENIAGIITEGKGVGGMVNYKGVQLERGYVADEDTSIYNPGLTLLTESEKERLVEAVIGARKAGLSQGQWSDNNEFAFDFLREKLDPFHMVELSGLLKFVPFYAAILYMGVLAVQQFARESFQIAYLVGVAAFFLPIVALIAAGV